MIIVNKDSDKVKVDIDPNNEHWMKAYWRPAMAFTYMFICIFDFFVMPSYTEKNNLKFDTAIMLAKQMPEKDQVAALTILTKNNHWDPLTLRENGFFHIAMMAILGVAAWTRGREKDEIIKTYRYGLMNGGGNDNGNSQNPQPNSNNNSS